MFPHTIRGFDILFVLSCHVETVRQLVLRKPTIHVNIDINVDELLQDKRELATYEQIKEYILEYSGLNESHTVQQKKRWRLGRQWSIM